MKVQAERDISVGGPDLATEALKTGLVDECHLFVVPIVVGGGKRSLPNDVRLELELLDERRFEGGVVHLHYRTRTEGISDATRTNSRPEQPPPLERGPFTSIHLPGDSGCGGRGSRTWALSPGPYSPNLKEGAFSEDERLSRVSGVSPKSLPHRTPGAWWFARCPKSRSPGGGRSGLRRPVPRRR